MCPCGTLCKVMHRHWRCQLRQCTMRWPLKARQAEIDTMAEKTLAQTLFSVHTVRAANARIIIAPSADPKPVIQSPKVVSKIRDVNSAGQYAMQRASNKK